MKSVKERSVQRLVQLSADLARHVSVLLDIAEGHHSIEVCKSGDGFLSLDNAFKGELTQICIHCIEFSRKVFMFFVLHKHILA